jgi:hypothetical protein
MTTEQVRKAYQNKKDVPCPITERLIVSGYQQDKDGYIKFAYGEGIEVNYTKAQPTQWWHLIESYCERTDSQKKFGKSVVCGELILWMAEVLECVQNSELNCLADKIIESGTPIKRRDKTKPPKKYDRKEWNYEIQKLCFDKIVEKVENM